MINTQLVEDKISTEQKQAQRAYDLHEIVRLVNTSQYIGVIPSRIAGSDAFAAGAGLYHMLKESGKHVTFLYPGKVPDNCAGLIGGDEIEKDTSSRKLMVSIDYSGTGASNVQYSNENNVLQLMISPIPRNFDRERVKAGVTGYDFDVVFTVGVQSTSDLGRMQSDLSEELEKAKIINLDNTKMNIGYGNVNVIDVTASNLSEVVYKLASGMKIVPSPKAAKALLVGMTYREPKGDKLAIKA